MWLIRGGGGSQVQKRGGGHRKRRRAIEALAPLPQDSTATLVN